MPRTAWRRFSRIPNRFSSPPADALTEVSAEIDKGGHRVSMRKHFELMIDGDFFSQAFRRCAPGVSITGSPCSTGSYAPEEMLSLDEALRAITIDAAWCLRWENEIGSIRTGKKADFAVLEQDPYEVGVEGLPDIEIWGTVFEGVPAPINR